MNTRYDMPDNYYFGGGGDTAIMPLALVLLLLGIVLIFALRRRYMIIPLLVASILIPSAATLVIAGLHFPAGRILLLAAWLRLLLRRDLPAFRMTSLDKAFMVWALCSAVTFAILWGSMGAVVNRVGFLWTALGTYFLARALIRDKDDIIRVIRLLAVLVVVIAPFMVAEHFTQHNLFWVLGAPPLSNIREGVRAEGPFAHAIIAGTIGAMLLPLFVGLWQYSRRQRALLALAAVSSVAMAVCSASSTPLMTLAAGVAALLAWRFRDRMRTFRWGFVLALVCLQLVMKAPVWMLIARTGGVLGGSGYHRAMLMDGFFRHFGEWWLVGTQNNANWGWDMWDVDNAFVGAGVSGGLITLIAFLAIFVYAYKQIGKSRVALRKSVRDERLVWAIGACLFANTIGFFGIVYFDQSVMIWYTLLAAISALSTVAVRAPQREPVSAGASAAPIAPPAFEDPLAHPARLAGLYE